MIRPNDNDEIYDKDDDGEPDLTSAAAAAAAVRSSSHHRLSHLYTVHRTQRRRQQTVLVVVVVVASVVVGAGRQSRRVDDCWPIAARSIDRHSHRVRRAATITRRRFAVATLLPTETNYYRRRSIAPTRYNPDDIT